MRVLKALLCIFLISVPLLVVAQINTIKFKHYSTNEGLSLDKVKCIQQDTLGFLWIGALNGLNRYDGINFLPYLHDPRDSSSLSNNNITKIYEDHQGNLWVGTVQGLNKYNRELDNFQRFNFLKDGTNNASQNYVQDILEDADKNLWIATKKGLVLFNHETVSFQNYYVDESGTKIGNIAGNNVRCLYEDRDKRFWVGFSGLNGLQYFDKEEKKFVSTLYNPEEQELLLNVSISDIFEDSKGNFWLASRERGLLLFDRAYGSFRTFQKEETQPGSINSNTIWDIEEDTKGNLLLATEGGGLNTTNLNNDNFQFASYQVEYVNPYTIRSNKLLTLYKDKTGLIWIGTFEEGIIKIDPNIQKFTQYQSGGVAGTNLSNPDVSSILEDHHGNMWVGTFKGLNRVNEKRDNIDHFNHDYYIERSLSSDHVQCLLQDKSLDIWIGTSNGLDKIAYTRENKLPRIQRFSSEKRNWSLSHPSIRCLLEDNNRQLWIGTENGLNVLTKRRDRVTYYKWDPKNKRSISSDQIRCMLQDTQGNIWIGTEEGLNKFNPKTKRFQRFLTDTGINNDLIYCLYEDASGTIWVGTPGGLNKVIQDGKEITFESFNVKNGFADNTIHAIQEDESGNLWLSTNKGITKFNPSAEKNKVKNYTYQDGLQDSQFKSNSSYKNTQGELFFGGKDGLNIFNPATIGPNETPPKVVLTDFKIIDKSVPIRPNSSLEKHISVADKVVLASTDKIFSFEFAALNYTLPQKNTYAYKLSNDETWLVGNDTKAFFRNTDPGNYTFMVKAANNDGKWNEEPTEIEVIIEPTLVQTLYFKIGAFLALLGLSYLLFRTRVRQLRRNQQQLEETVKERTQQLQSQKEELEKALETIKETQDQLLTSEKMASLGQLTAGIAHEINNPINFISSNVQALKMDFQDVQDVLQKVKALDNHQDLKNGIKELMLVGKQIDVQLLQKEIEELLAGIERGTDRTVSIVSSLRTFSRNSSESFMPADIHEGLDSTLTILNSQFNGHISIQKNYGQLSPIQCQIGRLNQVFLNIINNAIHAIEAHPEGTNYQGKIQIQTAQTNGQIDIKIKDNGIGMDVGIQKRIFEPFYTTKDIGEGTGLGLSISYGIIEQHKGNIDVESTEGEGTIFHITLPVEQV